MKSQLDKLRHLKALRSRIVADGRNTKLAAKLTKRIKFEKQATTEQVISGLKSCNQPAPDIKCPLSGDKDLQGSSK